MSEREPQRIHNNPNSKGKLLSPEGQRTLATLLDNPDNSELYKNLPSSDEYKGHLQEALESLNLS